MIPLCIPEIRGNEWRYAKDCIDTGWVSYVGPYVDRFEGDLARFVGTRRAVATVSGTAALHVSLLLAGIEAEDEVLVSTLSFIAPANAIRYAGAWPVFIDADPVYWQMDVEKVREFLESRCRWADGVLRNLATGRRVRGLLPVHILGHPVDMDPLLELAQKYGLRVIEDATESLGAKYKGRNLGGLGMAGCFSFNGNKLVTTGGGGMIATDDDRLADRAKYLTTQAKDDPLEYIHGEVGYNYRLPNMQAAMGCAQLEMVEDYIAAKRAIATRYREAFSGLPGVFPMQEAPWAFSVFWMFTVRIDSGIFGMDSRGLLRFLGERKIQTRPLWQPLHLSPAHRTAQPLPCGTAERLHRDALSLPCSVGLTAEDQETVIGAVCAAHKAGGSRG